jgi:NADH:ubiquinone oxidoreductase subunit 5 (subunit L)/multisubunit Na+/H+ antiporter MnhA subunit
MPHQLIWLIFFLPLISFAIIALFIRPFIKPENRIAGYITITAIAGSLGLSVWALVAEMGQPEHLLAVPAVNW